MSADSFDPRDIIAPQSAAVEPEAFQTGLIDGMTRALLRTPAPPCLLRAPTGSGKTFVLSRVLENVSAAQPTLWLWFVPFVNLVQQTEDALTANCSSLSTLMLENGRNLDAQAGMVLLSTAQAVARAIDRKSGYNANADDDQRTLAAFVARARVRGLKLGLVVDEAHIGLDKATEFGRFAHWLTPDFLLMATASPKDVRLNEFLQQAGNGAFEGFAASRDEVVNARLNKRYIEAVVYDLRQSAQSVTDLKRTVLRRAWQRSQRIKKDLQAAGVALTPLLLVQVANGDKTVEAAERDLIELCGVHPGAIGKHSSDDPDPVLMAAIANDASKEVLIFKQAAGTGFDAPRAFVLASTKSVNDGDFAMQFIGRVMRVARAVREKWPKPAPIPDEFNTAYVFLADAEAQGGYESAVLASSAVKSQLEGQTEKLQARQMMSGAVVYTNRPSPQPPLMYDTPLPDGEAPRRREAAGSSNLETQASLFDAQRDNAAVPDGIAPDEIRPTPVTTKIAARPVPPASEAELLERLADKNIRAYLRRSGLANLPAALKRERRPEMDDMTAVSETAATRLQISEELRKNAVRVALNRLREKEIHTELTHGKRHEEDVQVITDRNALAREAIAILKALPQVEDEDVRIIIRILEHRLRAAIDEAFEDRGDGARPDESELKRYARDAAYWVIRREAETLGELLQGLIAESTTLEDAEPLPDMMLFPAALNLAISRKNIYGVLPPSDDDLTAIDATLMLDERAWLIDQTVTIDSKKVCLGRFDSSSKLNSEERLFAKALDGADFIEWWHRNPDRKPYAVRLVRGEHKHYFHPDFVVCLSHVPGDESTMRLIETKENVKDAERKARRVPKLYGKVLFLTKDQSRLRIINDDGSLGLTVDWDDLSPVREWLRASKPTVQ